MTLLKDIMRKTMKNELNHNRKLANLHSSVKNTRIFKKLLNLKTSYVTRAYNKAMRKASKFQLTKYDSNKTGCVNNDDQR